MLKYCAACGLPVWNRKEGCSCCGTKDTQKRPKSLSLEKDLTKETVLRFLKKQRLRAIVVISIYLVTIVFSVIFRYVRYVSGEKTLSETFSGYFLSAFNLAVVIAGIVVGIYLYTKRKSEQMTRMYRIYGDYEALYADQKEQPVYENKYILFGKEYTFSKKHHWKMVKNREVSKWTVEHGENNMEFIFYNRVGEKVKIFFNLFAKNALKESVNTAKTVFIYKSDES